MMLSPLAIGAVTESTNISAADFYRESHGHDLQGDPRALREGRAGRRDHRRRRARPRRDTRRGRRRRSRARARGPRAGGVERVALRAHRQRDGDAARADPRRQRHRAARLRPPRRDDRARRPRREDRLRPLAAAGDERIRAHRRPAQGIVRDDHQALRGRQRHHRHALRLPRPRPAHVGLPARQPDHHRGAPVDGKVGARALHGVERRRAARPARRAVHARDVEVGGDAAPDVRRGQGRVAAPAHRQARRRRLAAPHRRVRQAREGADLRRRHRLDHDDGDPLQAAAAEAARAGSRRS